MIGIVLAAVWKVGYILICKVIVVIIIHVMQSMKQVLQVISMMDL